MARQKKDEINAHQQAAYKTFLLPKFWFFNKKGHYEDYLSNVSVAANKRFNCFGFLNSVKKSYMAFSMSHKYGTIHNIENHKYSAGNMYPFHARNQYARNHMFLHLDNG